MRLTVVVPAYNVQDFVGATLRSVARQHVAVHEVIVVDDGSTDRTAEVIRETVAAHPLPNLTLIEQENSGVSVARNVGLQAASGDYVLFLDGDDTLFPAMNASLQRDASTWGTLPDVAAWRVHSEALEMLTGDPYPRGHESIAEWSTGPQTLRRVLVDNIHWHGMQGAAYRADFLREHGLRFTPGCAAAQDTEFAWKTLGLAKSVRYLNEVLSTYVWRQGSAVNSANIRSFDGASAYHRSAAFLAGLGPDFAELASAASDKVVPRFMGYLVAYCRSQPGGGGRVLDEIEERNPGLTALIRYRIREMEGLGRDVPAPWWLFARSPRTAVRYFESPWSVSSRPAVVGVLLKVAGHALQGDLLDVVRRRTDRARARWRLRLAPARVRHVRPQSQRPERISPEPAASGTSLDPGDRVDAA